MTTKTKIVFHEAQKAWTAEVGIESDDMSQDELLEQLKELTNKASDYTQTLTLGKMRGL